MNLTQPIPKTFDEMVATMLRCQQTQGQSVYQHGQSVCTHFFDIVDHIKKIHDLPEDRWKLPSWIVEYGDKLVEHLHDESVIRQYTTYHDCGKFLVETVDAYGKKHFPNHAQASKDLWFSVGGSTLVGNLIGWDMDIHILSSDGINSRCKDDWSKADATTLLLASLAEIHSNSKLFGGITSDNFKIKFKTVDRRGKQICKFFHD